jgi:hypothetical protein
MLDGWLDDLPERLLTHYVGGAWRAPLGGQMCVVQGLDGRVLGHVVCATQADLVRAQAVSLPNPNRAALAGLLRNSAARLAQDLDGLIAHAPDEGAIAALADRYAATGYFAPLLPHDATLLLPTARDALTGLAIARLAQAAGLPAGSIALLHAPLEDQIKRDP